MKHLYFGVSSQTLIDLVTSAVAEYREKYPDDPLPYRCTVHPVMFLTAIVRDIGGVEIRVSNAVLPSHALVEGKHHDETD